MSDGGLRRESTRMTTLRAEVLAVLCAHPGFKRYPVTWTATLNWLCRTGLADSNRENLYRATDAGRKENARQNGTAAVSEQPSVRVRIAVAVNGNGFYSADGGRGASDQKVCQNVRRFVKGAHAVHWIEADVPLPLPPQTIEGRVAPEPCPDDLLPDGPICPRCGGSRAPSGVGGGSWVHFGAPEGTVTPAEEG